MVEVDVVTAAKKRWINFILILCIIFCGLGYEFNRIEVPVAGQEQEQMPVYEASEMLSANQDVCTNELIGVRTYGTASIQEVRVKGRASGRSVLTSIIQLPFIEPSVLFSDRLTARIAPDNIYNAAEIVEYIHQKDGKKPNTILS